MPQLTVEKTIIPYILRKSKRAKRVSITIGSGGVFLTVPDSMPEKKALVFLEEKKGWVLRKYTDLCTLKDRNVNNRQFINGETVPFQGDEFKLHVIEYGGKRTKVCLKGDTFTVQINNTLSPGERKDEVRRKLTEFYRSLAMDAVLERIEYFKTKLNVSYKQVRIKEQKSRWGSCSRNGNLNFNWKIVMAPSDIIDYVVVHELCHLVHMNHSKEFWALVKKQIPDYHEKKRWLKDRGITLEL